MVKRTTPNAIVGVVIGLLVACGPATKFEGNSVPRVGAASAPTSDGQTEDATVAPPAPREVVSPEASIQTYTLHGEEEDTSVTFDGSFNELAFTLMRDEQTVDERREFAQLQRRQVSKSLIQGSAGREYSEEFSQTSLGLVDILVVVDSSSSMQEEHARVANRLPDLISQLTDTNWQIRIVTTDPRDSCARSLIKKSDPNPSKLFKEAILGVGTRGSGDERGVQAAIAGLQCSEKWIRANSNLAVLVVSDEDNCSNGDCSINPSTLNMPESLKLAMASNLGGSVRKLGDDARMYGLFKIPGDSTCTTGYNDAFVYQQLVADSQGVYGSICDGDYGPTLQQISHDIQGQLKLSFSLSYVPDNDAVTLMVNDQPLTSGVDYVVSGASLKFSSPPAADAVIKAVYRYGSTPRLLRFDLGEEIGAVEQVVMTPRGGAGEVLSEDDYQILGQYLVFAKMPKDGSEMMVTYRENAPQLASSFSIGTGAITASLRAIVDGREVEASYDKKTGIATLVATPEDGQSIVFSYRRTQKGKPILRLPANIDVALLQDLHARDLESGAEVAVTYDGKAFVVEPTEFVEGRKISIGYHLAMADESLVLPEDPSSSKVRVVLVASNGDELTCPSEQVRLVGRNIALSCARDASTKVVVQYQRWIAKAASIVLTADLLESAILEVFVNGKLRSDYKREGKKLVFNSPLPQRATVQVKQEKIRSK